MAQDRKDMMEGRGIGMSKDDDMMPRNAEGQQEVPRGAEERDSAGQHGRMAPQGARGLERVDEE
ncbi:MAG TPA: hypothetical protein VM582_01090 [Candidatus Thermoplasmatota archaeon]|nr:hypothetical protein [Candidatus Thermoplasmatota archaeon]